MKNKNKKNLAKDKSSYKKFFSKKSTSEIYISKKSYSLDASIKSENGSKKDFYSVVPSPISHALGDELPILTYLKEAYHSKGIIEDPYHDTQYEIKGKLRKTLRILLKNLGLYVRPFVPTHDKKIKLKNREINVAVGKLSKTINYSKLARDCGVSRTTIRNHIKKAKIAGAVILSQRESKEHYKNHPYSKGGPGRFFGKKGKKSFIYEELLKAPVDMVRARKSLKKTADRDFFIN